MAKIAITIDDVPGMYLGPTTKPRVLFEAEEYQSIASNLVNTLTKHAVPATAFVNFRETRAEQAAHQIWCDSAVEIGNHTATHLCINHVPFAQWCDDVQRCHQLLTSRYSRKPRYFRYPYLRYGLSTSLQQRAAEFLETLGYVDVPATIPTSDWVLSKPYRDAQRAGDHRKMDAIGLAFSKHVLAAVVNGAALGHALFDRDVSQVLVIHASTLTGDHMGQAISQLKHNGFEIIPVAECLNDSVYDMPNRFQGHESISWLGRVVNPWPAPIHKYLQWHGKQEVKLTHQFRSGAV